MHEADDKNECVRRRDGVEREKENGTGREREEKEGIYFVINHTKFLTNPTPISR